MGRKAHQLTEEEKEAFEDVIRLKDDVVNKILVLSKPCFTLKC